ncbi:bifunctional aspartokinase/homoserine dehydrogenase, chloroplastic-like [Henckelia pumila]|uniref:bifunctional aspartokinase/homoserine dehydrogenase, chloroplastic-like n=1 Tax=Henckelia pumila TaxID=405737 RepID=UPI003C6E8DD6
MAFTSSSSLQNLSSCHFFKPDKLLAPPAKIHPFTLLQRPPLSRTVHFSRLQGKDSYKQNIFASVTSADMLLDEAVEKAQLPKGDTWCIHKFGGTCVGNSERIQNVANIIVKDESERKLVVVSAMSKVTDMMYDLIYKAQARDDSYVIALEAVLEKHKLTAVDLLEGDELANFLARLHEDITNLKAMLRAIHIGMSCMLNVLEVVFGRNDFLYISGFDPLTRVVPSFCLT